MLFDWFTFIAQIINFVILVYLLWRFLYKPITKTMGKRQEELEDRWQKAQ
jgi:F-type H+-transporting ATPase subunit b